MSNKMLLSINNLGPINNAELDIAKINVVVGKNSTGKSTSSKFLYCLLTASSFDGIYLANRDIKRRYMNFYSYWSNKLFDDSFSTKFSDIFSLLHNDFISSEIFDEIYKGLYNLSDDISPNAVKNDYLKDLETIRELAEINKNPKIRHASTFNTLFNSEYGGSLGGGGDTYVKFEGDIEGESFNQEIKIANKNWLLSNKYLNYFNFKNIIYIDSPSVLEFDNGINTNKPIHFHLLNKKLRKSTSDVYDDEAYKNIIAFKKNFDDLIDGEFIYNSKPRKFLFKKDGNTFPMENTASGLKQLGILQILLENNELTEDSFLIMDEPEINLHPEFQIRLAQILVLASKELNLTIYINTHSPFLAEAIEVYSKYYGLYDDTNFYLTEESENSGMYDFNLIDDLDIMEVYKNLGDPFDVLNAIRFKLELNGDD